MKIQLLLSLTSLFGYSYAQQENKKLSILDRQSLHEYSLAKCSDGSSAAYYIDKVIYTICVFRTNDQKLENFWLIRDFLFFLFFRIQKIPKKE